jgi:methylglutaconyl-CoA hydratase
MIMQNDTVHVKVIGCTGTIFINRPNQDNMLTRAMVSLLTQALDDLYLEKRVRAIILTGSGSSFSHGRDVGQFHRSRHQATEQALSASSPIDLQASTPCQTPGAEWNVAQQWGDDAREYCELILRMLEITKPIIAAVNGPALAGGAGLVVASDVVVATQGASFGLPDPKRGLVAGMVAPLLCFRLGAGPAARLLLTSATIDAQEAHRLGIYHELVAPDQIWARAFELGEECAAGAPEAIQLTKRILNETMGEELATQITAGAAISATAHTTASAQEGLAAWMEGRPPKWK